MQNQYESMLTCAETKDNVRPYTRFSQKHKFIEGYFDQFFCCYSKPFSSFKKRLFLQLGT